MTDKPTPFGTTRRLLHAATVGAIFAGLGDAFWVVSTFDAGRTRELHLVRMVRRLVEPLGVNVLAWLPQSVNHAHDLDGAASVAVFALGMTLLSVVLTLIAVLALAPVLAYLLRAAQLVAPAGAGDRASPLLTAAALAIVGLPAYPTFLTRILPTGTWGARLFFAGIVWLVLTLLLRAAGTQRVFQWLDRAALASIASLIAAASAGALADRPSAAARAGDAVGHPNVLLVSIDSLRPDHLSCYGYERATSPRIDALAAGGTLFRTVVSPTSWTLPAHATMLTALPPEAHGVDDDGKRLGSDARLLAEVFLDAGYDTAGFVAGPYLDAGYGFGQGFQHYDDFTVPRFEDRASHSGATSPQSIETALQWLRRRVGERPFFLFLHLWDVHYDFEPPPPYDRLFDPDYAGSITGSNFRDSERVHAGMDARDLEHIVSLYDGEIRYTDFHLGQLIDELAHRGVLDDTVVAITADHGEEFFEHGRKGHRAALYDETILVPLVIRFPKRVPARRVVDVPVRLMDLAPTLLSLSGVARPPDFGGSVADAQGGRDVADVFDSNVEVPMLPAISTLHANRQRGTLVSVRTERFKWIRETGPDGKLELFDLEADPAEKQSHRDDVLAAEMENLWTTWQSAWAKQSERFHSAHVDDGVQERLRRLGYIE